MVGVRRSLEGDDCITQSHQRIMAKKRKAAKKGGKKRR